MDTYLVALLIGQNGPYLPKIEKDKPNSTICFTLRQRDNESSSIVEIASATAWDTCKNALDQISGPHITSDLIDIHKHLERRQHDAFCQSLFNLLKAEVSMEHDNWLVPLNINSNTMESKDESLIHQCIEKFFGSRLVQSINVISVDGGRIVISISDGIELVIRLIDTSQEADNIYNNSDNNNDNNDIDILRRDFTKTLRHCLLLSQSLLLKHFKDNGSVINRHSLFPKDNIYEMNTASSKGDRKKGIIHNVLYVMKILLERYRTERTLLKIAANIYNRGLGTLTFNLTINNDSASDSLNHGSYQYDITHGKFSAKISIDHNGLLIVSVLPKTTFSAIAKNVEYICNHTIEHSIGLEKFFENVIMGCEVRSILLNFELYTPSMYISVNPTSSTCYDIRSSSSSGCSTLFRIATVMAENLLLLEVIDDNLIGKVTSLCSSSSLTSCEDSKLFKLLINENSNKTITQIVQLLI